MLVKLFLLISVVSMGLFANDPWFRFFDKKTEHVGFKDKNGTVKLEPKFVGFSVASRFENIMAVVEDKNGNYESYYLLKSGKIVGREQLYVFDNTPDCESEGHIRFQDKKSELVGMFNAQGEVIVPAEYNSLKPMKNGLIVALKGGEKECLEKHEDEACEHFSFKGGTTYLLDKNNTVLIKNFNDTLDLNYFSMKITEKPVEDEIRENFLGVNGKYYSFVNYEKEFKSWIFSELVNDFSKKKLLSLTHEKVISWSNEREWSVQEKEKFYEKYFTIIEHVFHYLKKKDAEYFIGSEGLLITRLPEFESYHDTCYNLDVSKHPMYSIVVSYKKGFSNGDSFSFLKTDKGYKLVGLTLKTLK